jgi:hypothetical protein
MKFGYNILAALQSTALTSEKTVKIIPYWGWSFQLHIQVISFYITLISTPAQSLISHISLECFYNAKLPPRPLAIM